MTGRGGAAQRRPRIAGVLGSRRFALFGEMLVIGLAVSLAALPGVTALAAFAAGSAHLRRHLDGGSASLREALRDLGSALRGGWAWSAGAALAVIGVAVALASPAAASVPGGTVAPLASAVAAAAALLVLLRACARWERGASWTALVRAAARRTVVDLPGTALLALALALSGVIVWMFAPLVVVVPGLVTFAVVAVEARIR